MASYKQTIIFDFDGTLVDASERLYSLFCDLTSYTGLTKDEYWTFKRKGIGHERILNQLNIGISWKAFQKEWLSLIEDERYLAKDQLYPGVQDLICSLREKSKIYLLSARQLRGALIDELNRLRIRHLFDGVYVTGRAGTKHEIVENMFTASTLTCNESIYFIGDTPSDINDGLHFGFKTIAISHGFSNKERLQASAPHHLATSFKDIKDYISQCGHFE